MASDIYAQVLVDLPWDDKIGEVDTCDVMAAIGLYTAAILYCQDNLTDGRIPRFQLCKLAPAPLAEIERIAAVLESVNLFRSDAKAYHVHNYLKFNKSKAQVEGEIEQKRKSGRLGGQRSAQARIEASATALAQAPATAPAQALSNPDTPTDTDTTNRREEDLTPPADDPKPPKPLGNFPDCMAVDKWREGKGAFNSSRGHILEAIEAKHGTPRQTDLGVLGAAIKACCPDGCLRRDADKCAGVVIEKIRKAPNVKLAADWYRKDRGPVETGATR